MPARTRSAHLLARTLAALVCLACGPAPEGDPGRPYYDLAAHLPVATVLAAGGETSAISAQADPDTGTLTLAAGSSVAFSTFLDAGSRLRALDVVLFGRGTRVEVLLDTDEGGERKLGRLHGSRPALDLGMADDATPGRVVLRISGRPEGRAVLRNAALWAPPGASGSEAPAASMARSPRVTSRPNVLIYLIDTLRRDRLGCYGYDRGLTPNLDAFAAQATVFTDAVGQSTWTKASVASIFSGVWPPAHGATGWKQKLPQGFDTLAEVLAAAGYRTAAVSSNPHVVEHYDMDQGFESFFTQLKQTSADLNRTVFEWLDQPRGADPFLLYIHTMDPHAPYGPPEPFLSRFAPDTDRMPAWEPRWRWPVEALPYLAALYDADIAFNDQSFGELVRDLESRELLETTMIVVVSDHGEEFREHGQWRHGNNLHAPTLNVPLIIKYPGQRQGRRVGAIAQHIDLLPTILDRLELPIPEAATGRSLDGAALGRADGGSSPERIYSHLRLGRSPLVYSVIDGPWKLITSETAEARSVELFHRLDDPAEANDLAAALPVRTAVLEALLAQKILGGEAVPAGEEAVLDETMKQDLEALGYLE